MGLLLILPILVSGFITCHIHPLYFYKLHRYEGQYLYLQTAKLGFYCLGVAVVVQTILLWICDRNWNLPIISQYPNYVDLLGNWLGKNNFLNPEKAYSVAWLITISFFMMFLSPSILNLRFRIAEFFRHGIWNKDIINIVILAELVEDSPLDKSLMSGMLEDKAMMIDMDDRKVYVCRISSMGEPNENQGADQEIAIVPIVSGYRDKETLKVNLITKYNALDIDSALILKQENIVSIREFDFDVWDKFNPEESETTAE
jgi:hypothetical protein